MKRINSGYWARWHTTWYNVTVNKLFEWPDAFAQIQWHEQQTYTQRETGVYFKYQPKPSHLWSLIQWPLFFIRQFELFLRYRRRAIPYNHICIPNKCTVQCTSISKRFIIITQTYLGYLDCVFFIMFNWLLMLIVIIHLMIRSSKSNLTVINCSLMIAYLNHFYYRVFNEHGKKKIIMLIDINPNFCFNVYTNCF